METPVRVTRRAARAEEWALVLAAAGIPHRVAPDDPGFLLLVPDADVQRARAALEAYDEEAGEPRDPAVPEAASGRLAWAVGAGAGALLILFFALTGPPAAGSRWFAQGAASARHLLSGEPWRAVTALTLHVDAVHAAGNAVATAVLLPAVVQRIGPGYALWLVLLAGAAANLLGATLHDPGHVAVGASTATFGAVGILAALRLRAPPRAARARRKRWVVLAACLALVAMLGAGRDADVLGHVLGILAGGGLGLLAGVLARRPAGLPAQWSLVALAALAVVGCWHLALQGVAS